MSYDEWIVAYVARHGGDVWMKCLEACEEMAIAFPELTLVKGIAISPHGKRWCHCWLVTPDGRVVDPTASQFRLPVAYEHPRDRRPAPSPAAPPGTGRT